MIWQTAATGFTVQSCIERQKAYCTLTTHNQLLIFQRSSCLCMCLGFLAKNDVAQFLMFHCVIIRDETIDSKHNYWSRTGEAGSYLLDQSDSITKLCFIVNDSISDNHRSRFITVMKHGAVGRLYTEGEFLILCVCVWKAQVCSVNKTHRSQTGWTWPGTASLWIWIFSVSGPWPVSGDLLPV